MRKLNALGGIVILSGLGLLGFFLSPLPEIIAIEVIPSYGNEPDMPRFFSEAKSQFSKAEFMLKRAEGIGLKRGVYKDVPFDPKLRPESIRKMEKQEELISRLPETQIKNALQAAWTPIGPAPIPNGQTEVISTPVSGRVISTAIHPIDPDIVYAGTAQGGIYRTTDGGASWTPIFDSALSLAIGALAIAPTQPETLYVGTGEPNFSIDSYFGVGVYRIENAGTTANVMGPFNLNEMAVDVFSGSSVSEIIVHPTDPDTIFVSTTIGFGGIRSTAPGTIPPLGIHRSTNATSANPTFKKIGFPASLDVRDISIDPMDPNILVMSLVTSPGGIFRMTDALAPVPSLATKVFSLPCTSLDDCTAEVASQRSATTPSATFYAAGVGGVARSLDGGATWSIRIANGFCGDQCFYNIAIEVDPTDPDTVYLGGDPTVVAAKSTDGAISFTDNRVGVHVDSHVIEVAPSDPNILWGGSDGGIYKSTDAGVTITQMNTSQFSATQFMGLALHPTDPDFTIGGTQDNGTNLYCLTCAAPHTPPWRRIDLADGGYAVIDQNAPNTTDVRMYHTYFNTTGLQGYGTVGSIADASDEMWDFRGCFVGGTTTNGITCDGAVNFYAPLERGPGNPNTIYYGSDRLYRSSDLGVNHTVVSQNPIVPGVPISSIGISPQSDGVRIVGLNNGGLYGTSTGSATLVNLDPSNAIPDVPIGRTIVDPNSQTTAYVTLSAFGVNGVWKTTNLNSLAEGIAPIWTNASGTGFNSLPEVPVNAIVVDPQDSSVVFAGTDIGVYATNDGGATWNPFGTGLPRIAVFGMDITNASPRKLRIATHGRGMYEISPNVVSQSVPFDYDGDRKTDISIYRPGPGQWWIQNSATLNTVVFNFGTSTDELVPADFTGDGKNDVAFWRPSSGEWFILRSEDSSFFSFPFGTNGDIPAPGDFDGDGKADAAVFRPSSATWFIQRSSDNGTTITGFGIPEDKPVVDDYDGDGRDDIAIFRPSNSQWWQLRSTDGVIAYQFGAAGDKTVQGDYTGDGKADVAIYRPPSGEWFVLRSEDSSFFSFPFGISTDIPVPGDYDGDGAADAAVFRPSNNTWFINGSQSGVIIQTYGAAGDIPTPNAYVR